MNNTPLQMDATINENTYSRGFDVRGWKDD